MGLILAAIGNRAVIALLAVLTGSTVGTKLGRTDPFTGTEGAELERRILILESHVERIRAADAAHASLDWHSGAGLRLQHLEKGLERCLRKRGD